jgi:hypothetical protein
MKKEATKLGSAEGVEAPEELGPCLGQPASKRESPEVPLGIFLTGFQGGQVREIISKDSGTSSSWGSFPSPGTQLRPSLSCLHTLAQLSPPRGLRMTLKWPQWP